MYNTFEEIGKNSYISKFDKLAESFGLFGAYMHITNTPTKSLNNKIVFIFGLNEKKVREKAEKYFNSRKQRQKEKLFEMDLNFQYVIITDCEPFATHQLVVDCMRDIEFIDKLYNLFNKKLPDCISVRSLLFFKCMYANSIRQDINPIDKEYWNKLLLNLFNEEEKKHNESLPGYKKERYYLDGYKTNPLFNNYNNPNNCVPLEHLVLSLQSTSKIVMPSKYRKQCLDFLNNNKHILYWISKDTKVKFFAPEGQGFGPDKEDNNMSNFQIVFDSRFYSDIMMATNRMLYPYAFNVSVSDMIETEKNIALIKVLETDFENFNSLCVANNITYCIDDEMIMEEDGISLPVVVFEEDSDMIDRIFTRLSSESESFHIIDENNLNQDLINNKYIEIGKNIAFLNLN